MRYGRWKKTPTNLWVEGSLKDTGLKIFWVKKRLPRAVGGDLCGVRKCVLDLSQSLDEGHSHILQMLQFKVPS